MSEDSGRSKAMKNGLLGRIRAWLLIKTAEDVKPEAAAIEIYERFIDPRNEKFRLKERIVIRADVVKVTGINATNPPPCAFDLIIPVDALNKEELYKVIKELNNYGEICVAEVILHHPEAPYLANGFISIPEAKVGIDWGPDFLPESLELTRKSPGDNPWG